MIQESQILGNFLDFQGRLAFSKGKQFFDIGEVNSSNKKVIAVYVGNWFDFPHSFGMNRFLDVLEWIKSTLEVAAKILALTTSLTCVKSLRCSPSPTIVNGSPAPS